MTTFLLFLATLALAFANCFVPFVFDSCPNATLTCQIENENRYNCVAFARQPSKEDIPQYSWEVSAGKIVTDPKAHRITIDARGVDAKKLIVTLSVRWPESPRACETTVKHTIKLC